MAKKKAVKKRKKLKLIYIEWADSMTSASSWFTEKEALEWGKDKDWVIRETGWLLEENDIYILLATAWGPKNAFPDGEYTFHGVKKIPKGWIRKRRVLLVVDLR